MKADADTLAKAAETTPDACCGTTACCTPDELALDPAQAPERAKAAAAARAAPEGPWARGFGAARMLR
ncbi:hypothetical protein ACFVZH_24905 [Streptomyces sp. NPDC059534]|uniref:hypothetical protein n=1 Tax=Streptomyces sp. NPDC059534 TaxID=3346859 RepID=UPI00369E3079